MGLNKAKGNMYPWIDATWNFIRGRCPHECRYCYMRRFWPEGGFYFEEEELKMDPGNGKKIFVGSSFDMWASAITGHWIGQVLEVCRAYKNEYLFQTKNVARITEFYPHLPDRVIIGTTLESNIEHVVSRAPKIRERVEGMNRLRKEYEIDLMVSIEPVLDFDLPEFANMIERIEPVFVSIGGDSKNHHLPEPSSKKLMTLIRTLKKITEVRLKPNLIRIIKGE